MKNLILIIKRIAAHANTGLQINVAGRMFASSGIWLLVSRIEDFLKDFFSYGTCGKAGNCDGSKCSH